MVEGRVIMTQEGDLFYSSFQTPVGALTAVRHRDGLLNIEFGQGETTIQRIKLWLRRYGFNAEKLMQKDEALADVRTQLEEYFLGNRRAFTVPIDLQGTSFQKTVWNALLTIPYGETRSYKEVALQIGMPRAVRAIGQANHENPVPIIVPCHRVIGSNGELIGYGGGLSIKEKLLALEQRVGPQMLMAE